MKINNKFSKAVRRMLSVAVCLFMLFTTFFIFDPAVLSELFPKASAVTYSKVTNADGTWVSGTDYTLSGGTYTIKTGNGFAYFLKNPTTFNGKKIVLDCDVDFSGITYQYWDESATAWYGELDGANHTVANYTQDKDGKDQKNVGGIGVIRKMSGGIVKNLTIKDAYIKVLNRRDKSGTNVYGLGALIGIIANDSSGSYTDVQINNVTVNGAKIIKFGRDGRKNDYGYGCGGIVGQTYKKTIFTNCKVVSSKISPNQDDNRRGNKEGGFVGESIGAEIVIKNDTPMVSVDSTTVVYDKDLADKDSDHGGLIGWTSGKTTIENVIMEGTVYSGDSCGGMVGYIGNAALTVNNSTIKGKIEASNNVGGIVGNVGGTATINVSNCSNEASITGGSYVGGFVGYASDSSSQSFTNCTNNGTVSASGTDAGGILGKTDGYVSSFSNCHNTGAITASGSTAGGMFGYVNGNGRGSTVMKLTSCTNTAAISSTGSNYVGGLFGCSDMPVNISNGSNTGKITGGEYVGGIAGKIQNGTITITDSNNTGTIYARSGYVGGIVGLVNPSDTAGATIKNCKNTAASFTANGENIGGIVGKNLADKLLTIENCHNTSTINVAQKWVGGLVGFDKGELVMKNSTNTANITGRQYTGGLIAGIEDDGCTITGCLNTGNVSTGGNSNGAGIVSTIQRQTGSATWTISNTVNTGNVSGASALGGFVGYLGNLDKAGTVNINNCVNKGNVTSTGNDAGGIVGNIYNHGSSTQHHKYTNLYNYGNVSSSSTGDTYLGGIVGKEYGFCEFSGCENYGNITESATSGGNVVGGIVGWIQDDTSSVQNCTNYGQISGRNNVGGIVGEFSTGSSSSLTITQCGNYGTLVAKNAGNTQIGGIMGRFSGNTIYISKCFNGNGTDGTIASSSSKGLYAGGIIGYGTTIYIADSYNNAPAVYGNTAGGLVGWCNNAVYLYNSYNKTSTGITTQYSGNKTPSSTAGCYTNTISTGTSAVSTLNTSRTVSGISSVGNAYTYKSGINNNYPVLSWQVNTLTKNVGRNLISDLIADTAKSGFTGSGSTYSVKLDGVKKTYYYVYTKTVNGVTVNYSTVYDNFTLDGTPTDSGTFNILSVTNPETKSVYTSEYYVGGNAVSCSVKVQSNTVGRTSAYHKADSVSAGSTVTVSMYVTPNVPVMFDNYVIHASMDYTNNATATSDSLVDLHSKYSDLGTPTKTGYNFLGWYTARRNGTKITDGSTIVNSGTPSFNDVLDRDVDIYATWDPITYTINYDGNGETSGLTASSAHTYDEAKNLTKNGYNREFTVTFDYNYSGATATTATATSVFNGWLCDKDGKTYADGASVINLTTVDRDEITMTAQWTDSSVSIPSASRTGYKFDGWFTAAEGGTEVEGTYTPTANTTLYAHWTPITYTVSYNGSGATSGSTASSTHTYDVEKALTSNGYNREFTVTFDYNYSGTTATTATATSAFNGWLCDKDGKTYADGASVINLTTVDKDTITMTAQWADVTVDFPTPTRTGYTFKGWATADGKAVNKDTVISENITLYAQWDVINYTVTFKNGDQILQSGEWAYGSTPTYSGDTPTKAPDQSFEYKFSGWSPAITTVDGDVTYTAQFEEVEHSFKSVELDGDYHRLECTCGIHLDSAKHNVEKKDGEYVCKDCGYVVPNFVISTTAEGVTITKDVRASLTTKYYVATVTYNNATKPNKDGKYFVYWYDTVSGEIVSAYTTYNFFLTQEVNIIPVFASQKDYYTERAKATAVLRMMNGCIKNNDGTYSILAEHSVSSSEGKINKHGIIYTTDSSQTGNLTLDNTDTAGIEVATARKTQAVRTGMFEVKISGSESGIVYARPYAVIENANGEITYKYGEMKTYDLSKATSYDESEIISTSSYDLGDISAEEPIEPVAPTVPTDSVEDNTFGQLTTFFVRLIEIIKTVLSFFGITGVAK